MIGHVKKVDFFVNVFLQSFLLYRIIISSSYPHKKVIT